MCFTNRAFGRVFKYTYMIPWTSDFRLNNDGHADGSTTSRNSNVPQQLKLGWLCILLCSTSATAADLPTEPGWHAIPNTKLRTICAGENGFPSVLGASGCWAITGAWNGGIFDSARNRMIIFGGGHNDYYGNELYSFDLDTLSIERITNPGLPVASGCVTGIANNTQPNSRHTYDGIEYIANLDKMFVFGGSLSCESGNFGSDTWTFDFQSNEWKRMDPSGPIPDGDAGMMTAYDPTTDLVYLHDRQHLYSYDAADDRYTRLSSSQTTLGYHLAATIHPSARKFVIVGYDSVQGGGRVYTYDIGSGSNYAIKRVSTSGGGQVVGDLYPGLEYDPTTNNIVAWSAEAGNAVYSLDVDTGEWTATSYANGPTPTSNGTHGRWRYSAKSGVFVAVNRVDDNIFVLKSSSAPIARPNPPESVKAQ